VNKLNLLKLFSDSENFESLINSLNTKGERDNFYLKNLNGSQKALLSAHTIKNTQSTHLFILQNLEEALYFLDDLNNIIPEHTSHLFPSSERIKLGDKNILLEQIEVLNKLSKNKYNTIISYPKAIKEKIITKSDFKKNQIRLSVGDEINQEDLIEKFHNLSFNNNNIVVEPGDFSIRGFIIDIFSYGNEYPYRIVFDNNTIEEINYFKVSDQMSIDSLQEIDIVSNIQDEAESFSTTDLFSYLPKQTIIWINNSNFLFDNQENIGLGKLRQTIQNHQCLYTGPTDNSHYNKTIVFQSSPQPTFNKNFEILISHLDEYRNEGYQNIITVSSENQMKRLQNIFKNYLHLVNLINCENSLKEGFIDRSNKIILYTDHQIFERHHQYKSKRIYKTENTLSIKELTDFKKGDYVAHFDYGIGMFDGLRIKTSNNKKQESIRIIYKNNDVLYISVHSLHKISKYKESSEELKLDKLGSPRWKNLKERVKGKVKTIAFDLIKLYAKRKITKGFAFSKDTYLQHELEASFIFQETEDQIKITEEIKKDMESTSPMDRLVCGDVGFGKTEIAIRAAFKAVADNKQVAILVPTTILALQHNKTFQKRLEKFPCTIKYLNRFVSKKDTLHILDQLKDGLIDIIIGTHRLISKDVVFKDLGLLIIDEEQKFGVSSKDKLKSIREHVDTLTLTATPIPRTLQFSLMGSRDLSIMTTYPKNRNPIETNISVFNHELLKEIITYEITRGGQVFFVHNRIANIEDLHHRISQMCPNLNIRYAHGQMEAKKLENTILDFINGDFDVLITTTIIENGLDIPNANTIIINNAQNFGLADLHQMRGRVGRSNKKAFCYLLTPPFNKIKDTAMKRLNAITNLSSLGDGFNIAMKDLEIRGAGNMLGAEQSGFIEEMGFSNYQKIIDEAINELKESEFKKASLSTKDYTNKIRCSIETDLELLIPIEYVSDLSERMNLYQRLSSIQKTSEIQKIELELKDRFGKIPEETIDLLESIKLRELAEKRFCEKIILKKEKMIITFNKHITQNILNNIIKIIQEDQGQIFSIKEDNNKMKLYVNNVESIYDGIKTLQKININ
jgi:transcription-repair coupling factor (superfamily II helicase)